MFGVSFQAFYRAFNTKDLEGMSKLWASEVTKWGPLLFFQDRDESFKMACTCTHPNGARLQGRVEIMTSLVLGNKVDDSMQNMTHGYA